MKEYIVIKKFKDKYNEEIEYKIGERLILNETRAAEMNFNKIRVQEVLEDEYTDLILKKNNGPEETTEDTIEDKDLEETIENTIENNGPEETTEDTIEDKDLEEKQKKNKKRG